MHRDFMWLTITGLSIVFFFFVYVSMRTEFQGHIQRYGSANYGLLRKHTENRKDEVTTAI